MSRYTTEAELAELFGVRPTTVRDWRLKYQWPHLRTGNVIRYLPEHIEQIERMQTTTKPRNNSRAKALKATAASAARRR